MRILFLLPSLNASAARQILRIELLSEAGATVHMVAFTRSEDRYAKHPALAASLGEIANGDYLRRIPLYLKSIYIIRNQARSAECIITYGIDLTLLAWLSTLGTSKTIPIVLDLLDIRGALLRPTILGKILRAVQRFIIAKIRLLIVSSPQFVTEYLEKREHLEVGQWQVIENKVDIRQLDGYSMPPPCLDNGPLTIGYFGILRCQRSLDILLRAVERSRGGINLYIRGIATGLIHDLESLSQLPNVIYGGPYRNPQDLAEIYGACDLIWACYPYSEELTGNWCWARTNRFYEACFFHRPPICNIGTQDAVTAVEKRIGLTIDLDFPDQCIEKLVTITQAEVRERHLCLRGLPKQFSAYTDEHNNLYTKLLDIAAQ